MCRENTIYKNCHINLRGIKPIVKVRLRDLSFNMVYNIVYSIVSQSLPSVVENIKPEKTFLFCQHHWNRRLKEYSVMRLKFSL